jgi:hypothetical protein
VGEWGTNNSCPMPNAQCPMPNEVKFIAIFQKQSTLVKSNGLLGARLLFICLGK